MSRTHVLEAAMLGCLVASIAGCQDTTAGGQPDAGAVTDGAVGGDGKSEGPIVVVPPSCVDQSQLPAWRRGMAIGEWKQLPSANLAAVTPSTDPVGGGFYGRIEAWGGFAGDITTSTLYLAASGGHSDYAGNEVYALPLDTATPTWTLETPPSPRSALLTNQPYYTDGRPSASHLYWTEWYVAQRRKVFRFAGVSVWGDGNSSNSRINSWSPQTKAWDAAGTNPDIGLAPSYEMPGALDLLTGDFYQLQANNRMYRWNQAANTVTDLGRVAGGSDSAADYYKAPAVIDPKRQRLVVLKDAANAGKIRLYDLASSTWSTATVTGATEAISRAEQGMAWFDSCAERIVFKTSEAGTVYLIDPETWNAVVLPTSGTIPPEPKSPNGPWGVHTLFQYMPKLGGYAYQPTHASRMYFLATQ